jgi:hypothetical protein
LVRPLESKLPAPKVARPDLSQPGPAQGRTAACAAYSTIRAAVARVTDSARPELDETDLDQGGADPLILVLAA